MSDANPKPTADPHPLDWSNEDSAQDARILLEKDYFPAYWKDSAFFRLVVLFAGWALLLSIAGMLILATFDKTIPDGVVAVSSGLVGLLTGIFAAKSSQT
jgi:hypothetical protein